jgi:hypothetical protein
VEIYRFSNEWLNQQQLLFSGFSLVSDVTLLLVECNPDSLNMVDFTSSAEQYVIL